ncbi:MAG: hypothetical protein RLZZ445_2397 [Pseudomonadota bacterium]
MSDGRRLDIADVQRLQSIPRRQDVADLNLAAMHTLLHRCLDRLFAEHIIGRNKSVNPAIRIDHQQQAHTALDHPAVGLIDRIPGENDDGSDLGQIGHTSTAGLSMRTRSSTG